MNFKDSIFAQKMCIIFSLIVTSLLFCEPSNVPNNDSNLIPRSILFDHPLINGAVLSPDGEKIAFCAPYESVLNIWIKNVSTGEIYPLTKNKTDVSYPFWAYNNTTILYFDDSSGKENHNVFAVDSTTGTITNLTPFPDVQVRFIRASDRYPDVILIGMNKDDKRLHDVYSLNIVTGELNLIEKNPGYICGFDREQAWYADNNFTLRIAYKIDDQGNTRVLYRGNEQCQWEELFVWDVNTAMVSAFLGFEEGTDNAYFADASNTDKSQFIKINLKTKAIEVLAQNNNYDVIPGAMHVLFGSSGLFKHPVTKVPLILNMATDTYQTIVCNDSLTQDIKYLQNFKNGIFEVVSSDMRLEKWIVAYLYDNQPSEYYMYDRKVQTLSPIIQEQDPLLNYRLAPMEPISFTSRDNLDIHGYLTYPTTTDNHKNLPVVILVHGGPWVRDTWGFDTVAQFLANRGYACLQINYRASSGYGKSFVKAGNKELGRRMQHDLTDGVQWLIHQGIADPKRIAIMGHSFGGYTALAGVIFTPDLYACAVDLYGRSNLIASLDAIPPYWERSFIVWKYLKGDTILEADMLKERSPIFHVDKIHTPLLIAHGAHDVRIHHTESDQIIEKLKEKGVPCEYLLFSTEGHMHANVHNKNELYKAIELFLSRYLHGRYEN